MAYIVSDDKFSGKCIQLISRSVDILEQPTSQPESRLARQSASQPVSLPVPGHMIQHIYIYHRVLI